MTTTSCAALPPRSLSPLSGDGGAHSNCSDCSICLELAATPTSGLPIKKANGFFSASIKTISPLFSRKKENGKVRENDSSLYDTQYRSPLQSPLISKRADKIRRNGLPGGESDPKSDTITELSPKSSIEDRKEKKPGKWRLKIKTNTIEEKCSETSSHSSQESAVLGSRHNSKRKKIDKIKKSHSRGSSFDYRLFKDMFKSSLPRSRSAGELADQQVNSILEVEQEDKPKTKLKSGTDGKGKGPVKPVKSVAEEIIHPLKGNGLVGLKNLGNTCFMNSIIQCLSHTDLVRDYFVAKRYRGDLSSQSKMQGRLAEEFASLLSDLWSGKFDTVSPNKFKSTVAKSAPRFVGYSQQDSQEFLRFFLEGLHEDLNQGRKGKRRIEEPPKGLSDSQLADHRWKDYITYDNSSIVNIFVGLLKSSLTCSVCGHKSVTFDPFWDLSLPLPRSRGSSLNMEYCFSEFTQEEILDGDEKPTCENCKKRQKCTKQFSIERFPPILVVHLKRFSEVRYRTKLATRVDFPIDNLDLTKFSSSPNLSTPTYDLIGVSNHSGNTFSGHYIAYCKANSQWHRFSDSSVSNVSKADIVSSEAYVLFYERKR